MRACFTHPSFIVTFVSDRISDRIGYVVICSKSTYGYKKKRLLTPSEYSQPPCQTIDPSLRLDQTSSCLSPALRTNYTNLFLELVELGDVVEEGGDDGGEQQELFGREVLEGVHDGEVPLDRHRPARRGRGDGLDYLEG